MKRLGFWVYAMGTSLFRRSEGTKKKKHEMKITSSLLFNGPKYWAQPNIIWKLKRD
jgi:hypothetical protein